jgi:hypothetical protein
MSKKYTDARINGLSFEDKLRLFGSVLTSAREDILLAGRLLVAMRKEKADALDQIVKRYNLPEKKLRALEEIGLGHLDPIWLTDTSPVARLVLQRQLCTEDQKKLVTGHYIPCAGRQRGAQDCNQADVGDEPANCGSGHRCRASSHGRRAGRLHRRARGRHPASAGPVHDRDRHGHHQQIVYVFLPRLGRARSEVQSLASGPALDDRAATGCAQEDVVATWRNSNTPPDRKQWPGENHRERLKQPLG